jgi:hypothetical protein
MSALGRYPTFTEGPPWGRKLPYRVTFDATANNELNQPSGGGSDWTSAPARALLLWFGSPLQRLPPPARATGLWVVGAAIVLLSHKEAPPVTKTSKDAATAAITADADQSRPTKIGAILALLQRAEGATLSELTDATGWQKHTARAALTSLKKKGHTIERTKADGVSRYRIASAAAQ